MISIDILPYFYRSRSLLNWIYAFYQIFLCLLANVMLLTIKFCFACNQIYSHFVININRNIAPFLANIIYHKQLARLNKQTSRHIIRHKNYNNPRIQTSQKGLTSYQDAKIMLFFLNLKLFYNNLSINNIKEVIPNRQRHTKVYSPSNLGLDMTSWKGVSLLVLGVCL